MNSDFIYYSSNSERKAKRITINWSEHLEAVLLAQILSRKAFMRTSDNNLETKWALVRDDCKAHQLFAAEIDKLTIESVRKKWNSLRNEVSGKYSLEKEGANLSGLPENASANLKQIYNMIVTELKHKSDKLETDIRKAKRNDAMLRHEGNIIYININYNLIYRSYYWTTNSWSL
jgi:hypothetical protein